MGVVTLQRRNALDNRFASRTLTTPTSPPNPNPKSNNNSRSRRNRRSPKGTDHRSPSPSEELLSPQRLVMGEVRILKRGEVLSQKKSDEERKPSPASLRRKAGENNNKSNNNKDLVLCSTDRLGPEPEMVCKQVKILDLYAGAVTDVPSPAPSALPFPSRLIKGAVGGCGRDEGFAAAVDLRRLLRI